jgi:hypothetical protein
MQKWCRNATAKGRNGSVECVERVERGAWGKDAVRRNCSRCASKLGYSRQGQVPGRFINPRFGRVRQIGMRSGECGVRNGVGGRLEWGGDGRGCTWIRRRVLCG